MSLSLTNLEKCTGAMLASAIGDALGWPNESRANNVEKNRKKYDCFVTWTRRCRGANWHYEKIFPGEYSDDTQMILAVSRSIITGNWENVLMNKELPYWLEYQRGGGKALLKAANFSKQGRLLWKSNNPGEYFNAGGNGAVMRILPHVIVASKKNFSEDSLIDVIKDSIMTHGHPRAILGATCYAYALEYLLKKDSVLEYGELVTAVLEGQNHWGAFPQKEVFEEWIEVATHRAYFDYMKEWNTALKHMVKQLDYISDSLKKGLMLDDNEVLEQLECFGKVGGAGDVTVLAAIYLASKYANNPVLGIKTPAFLTGIDTDTIASVTGGLLGMLCGVNWIPLEWKGVQDYDCILKITEILLSDDMTEAARTRVAHMKKKYKDWINTSIGKMHLVSTSTVTQNKSVTVFISKYESTLGQTLYFKEYKRNDYGMQQYDNKMNSQPDTRQGGDVLLNDMKDTSEFVLSVNDVADLLEVKELQKISFKKVLKVVEKLLTTDDAALSIAKQVKVDLVVVNFLKNYIKNRYNDN
ncbi:MAG: ADP-ribosylglycohydrolase family protein [Blautia sp.]|nr:ADP-ribosylglycohydrolase family protein [Lachnoclostridium sp.]MCM1212350.1 ADP-ribosylglycohydrolase family protein [Blautia sp.]